MTESAEPFSKRFEDFVSRHPTYEPRPGQVRMAETIHAALEGGAHAVIEAGTGSGKSFGYLIPLLEGGEGPFVVSTGTIALQEQLLQKDIPFVQEASGREWHVALAKGRHNYLCKQKFWEADRRVGPLDPLREELDRLKAYLPHWDGDLATMPWVPSDRLWDEVHSDADDCLGARCEFYEQSPQKLARQRTASADLVVANHALYFADLASGGGILPSHRAVVFDEAHHVPLAATRSLTASIGRYSNTKLLQKIRRRIGMIPDEVAFSLIDLEHRLLDWVMQIDRPQARLYPDATFIEIVEGILEQLRLLKLWMERDPALGAGIDDPEIARKAPLHRARLMVQLDNLIARWEFFGQEADATVNDRVNWIEQDRGRAAFEFRSAPIDVAPALHQMLWTERSSIHTSATLAVRGDFEYYRRKIGLAKAQELELASPFDYETQATLYVPRYLPEPNDPDFTVHARTAIREILEASQGRAFVLFTSYRAMNTAHAQIAPTLPFPAKRQGEASRGALISWFRETPNAVLFATSSFWEGVDIPGEALSCVIIDRLPFSVPDDPIVQAHVERLKLQGRDWFREYTLPEAIIRLKQGFGRLIRTREDRGLVAILDNRLFTKGYGQQILAALPRCPRVRDLSQVRW
ncbi:MAG: ATP-dependent DNA helicase [bacterium]|nr:ATP-dependent DNA helicase [bacterium]